MELGGTPRARPALKFANRTYTSSPQSATKRLGTPQSARKSTRFAESTLSRSTTTGNIFRASSMASASAPASRFELGASTLKKSFITSNLTTPETKRVYRDTVAKFTPRGLAAHSDSKELFEMRIPSPPPELNGEELAKRVPRELERRGAVYADQYLSHIVPKNFDDLQRRQFFCILDLRRLKHAADDVFLNRDWKLNILNFAKEFEKSRSLILLRYGLYEFQNVKPNSDVLRRWKISHGLPVDDEEPSPKAAGSTGSKRKATEDIAPSSKSNSSKHRLFDKDASTPKRKNDEDQSRKIVKPASSTPVAAPSATLSLFESIANKSITAKEDAAAAAAAAPVNPFVSATSTSTSSKPNPFASAPAKGNDSESDSDDEDQPAKAESADEHPAEDSTGSSVFRSMTKAYGETPEPTSTNSNSDNADKPKDEPTLKKTWTPDTPIKFAPAAPANSGSLFGSSTPAAAPSSTSLFGAKPATTASTTPTTNLFGAKKPEEEKETEENSKENHNPEDSKNKPASLFSSKPVSETSKSLFGSTPSATLSASDLFGAKKETTALATTSAATPTTFASSLFGAKPTESNTPAPAPATSLFGDAAAKLSPTYSATTSNLFGAAKTGSPVAPATSIPSLFGTKSTTLTSSATTPLFGAKPAESSSTSLFGTKKEEPASSSSLFGSKKEEPEVPKSLFGSTPTAPSTGSSLFGSTPAAAPASTNLFGSSKPSLAPPPTFNFSAPKSASSEPKPLLGADPIEGSPMKQDSPTKRQLADDSMQQDSSPVSKKLFGAISGSAAPTFSFGASTSAPAASAPAAPTFSFGSQSNNVNTNSQPAAGGSNMFGNAGSSFTFGAGTGGASANSSFNNPFAGNNNSAAAPAASVSSFNFGAGGNTSTPTPPPSFNFGAGGASQDSNAGTSNMFSFNASASNNNTAGTRSSVPPSGRKTLVPKSLRGRSNSPAVSQQNNAALPNPFANGGTPSFNFGGNGTNGDTPAASTDKKEGTTSTEKDSEKDINKTEAPKSIFDSNPTAPTSTSLFGAKSGTDKPAVTSLFGAKPSIPATSLFDSVKIEAPKTSLFGSTPTTVSPGTASTSVAAEAKASDAEAPQEQINLTEGGPGEEDEEVVYEVRTKMSQFVKGEGDAKSKWETQGVGPLRLLKHKTKGTVRMLLRREPTGHIAFNRSLLTAGKYESTAKSVKIMTAGPSGLEIWLAQVKTADAAAALAKALEEHKACNKKD